LPKLARPSNLWEQQFSLTFSQKPTTDVYSEPATVPPVTPLHCSHSITFPFMPWFYTPTFASSLPSRTIHYNPLSFIARYMPSSSHPSSFFNIRLTFVSLFCMFAFYFAYSVSLYCFAYCFSCCIYATVYFLFLHKFTDHCHRVQTKFRLISIISYIISNHIISYYVP